MLIENSQTIAQLFGAHTTSAQFSGVSIDSRQCNGMLFVAIKGKVFDGHDFIEDAISNGAKVVVTHKDTSFNVPTIVVPNTTIALGRIAKFYKDSLHLTVIGITGSNGKTTTKNMLYNIFSTIAPTFKTPGNFNNHIGVPLSLLQLTTHHKYAIIEMGANHIGEIAYLRSIVEPDIACVINTLDAHIGEFGGKENLIRAKGELYSPASKNIVNTNTCYIGDMSFGVGGDVDYDYLDTITLSLLGEHNKENALAATAIAKYCRVLDANIKKGLEATTAQNGRMELMQTANFLIINDSYNASPNSMRFALQTLSLRTETTIAILGKIVEIGDKSSEILEKIGKYAKSLDIDYIYSVGSEASDYGVEHFDNEDALVRRLQSQHKGATVLFKGSRVTKLETIIAKLQD